MPEKVPAFSWAEIGNNATDSAQEARDRVLRRLAQMRLHFAEGRLDRVENSPGADKESNWLPAPPGDFVLMLRLYWPDESDPSIIDGSWKVPPAKKV
jgi:hypothetical protein